ncbi:SRPBCC family protein [Goodfellowiella coeruleoviolacea]|uniref:Polyketide cyclase / dehydrase and lipid transport n=1 Tax=Goodfellowiella coeruleoviolacea TaxID=334858 RepID=A0AAE3GIL7_9PSEU|nr:SRPBCC family protein [Goodfellowiella coeruleoviolacea]MCP2166828.1 Polyketide cyclase / dehydrase and lipid transport [Goodfellowiella coeruleoviolacea]
MTRVTVEQIVQCTPDEFLALVMDAERYALVDDKLGRIDWVRRSGDVTDFQFRSRLPGIPGPAPKVVSRMRLTPGVRVDVRYAPLPHNRFVRRVSTFAASFVCEPVAGGTRVVRTIEIGFAPVLRWLAEPLLRRALPADVEREVLGAKNLLERGSH